tara:strand:- start:443 stop:649 length:207 start_codon:yes stop_codon:yes gene_type:complete
LPGGKIELTDPDLPGGEAVDVFVLLPDDASSSRPSAVDILAQFPGQRLFKTAEEVEAHLRDERDSWDR